MSRTIVVDGTHLKRMMQLCRTLAGSGATLKQLQTKLKASRRTIFRDLSILGDWGISVTLGDKGYKIKQNAASCRKLIADRETKALQQLLNSCLK
jgi:biotin operon repressor